MKHRSIVFGIRVASLVLLGLLTTGCVSNERFEAASNEVENQDEVIRRLKEEGDGLRARNRELENKLALANLEAERLRGQAGAARDVDRLKDELASLREKLSMQADATEGVTVRETPEGTAFSVEGRVLFEFGKADITTEGKRILAELASKLVNSGRRIRVEGHTDNVPVNRLLTKFPRGNLELSGERALRVADFLINDGGMPRSQISFAGYGAEQPVADNSTDDGRSRNRRVEIVVLNLP